MNFTKSCDTIGKMVSYTTDKFRDDETVLRGRCDAITVNIANCPGDSSLVHSTYLRLLLKLKTRTVDLR